MNRRSLWSGICGDAVAFVVICIACVVSGSSYFIHLSDPHVDFKYQEGTGVDCALRTFNMPCCHDWTNLTPCSAAPRFGHTNCDLPRETAIRVIQSVAKDYPHPFLVMVTGDVASHDLEFETPLHIAQKWDWLFKQIKTYFGDNVKIISCIGNHDVFPADQMSDNKTDEFIFRINHVMLKHGVIDQNNVDESIFAARGYYKTSIPNSNVDAIVMNNIVDNTYNTNTDGKNTDPAGMYSWMKKAVDASVKANRKVWLVGHQAPSYQLERTRGVSAIRTLLDEFGDKAITGMFYGHTHKDEFMLVGMKSLESKAENVALFAPGMTCISRTNPSARVVEVDGPDLTLVDYHQYRMDLQKSNTDNQFIFNKVYSFRQHYEVPDLSPKSFQDIAQRILTNETFALRYLNTRSTYQSDKSCGVSCRRQAYCTAAFRETSDLFKACNKTQIEALVNSFDNDFDNTDN